LTLTSAPNAQNGPVMAGGAQNGTVIMEEGNHPRPNLLFLSLFRVCWMTSINALTERQNFLSTVLY
jgi:hypothetical protein